MLGWIKGVLATSAGIMVVLGFLGLAVLQMALGAAGIEHELGGWWAWGAVVLALMRFTLPLTIGTYFGVTEVLGWHPLVAILITLPGLLFVIPGLIRAVLGRVWKT